MGCYSTILSVVHFHFFLTQAWQNDGSDDHEYGLDEVGPDDGGQAPADGEKGRQAWTHR